jgi:hypothetical protein
MKNYIYKNLRLDKDKDKELIKILNELSKERKFSEKVKEILKNYFKLNKSNEEVLLEKILQKLSYSINIEKTETKEIKNYESKFESPKSFNDLLKEDDMGDEEEWI